MILDFHGPGDEAFDQVARFLQQLFAAWGRRGQDDLQAVLKGVAVISDSRHAADAVQTLAHGALGSRTVADV